MSRNTKIYVEGDNFQCRHPRKNSKSIPQSAQSLIYIKKFCAIILCCTLQKSPTVQQNHPQTFLMTESGTNPEAAECFQQ